MGKIKRLPLTIEAEQNGVRGIYLISLKEKDKGCEDVKFIEMKENIYEIETSKKFDLLDFSIIVYNFINSQFFSEKNAINFGGKLIHFSKKESYNLIVEKLRPCFC